VWERYEAGAWLVVPTNTNLNSSGEAIMGAGVAGAVAERFPGLPARYGEVLASGRERMVDSEHRLLLAPTKRCWKAPSVPEMVDELLEAVAVWAREHPEESVVLPAPGCGLGGLDFAEVSARCRTTLAGLAVTLVAPDGTVVEMVEAVAGGAVPVSIWPRVAVTGHRSLEPSEAAFAKAELARLAGKLRDHHGTTTAISGMALGADTWWAEAAVDAGMELWAYIPFEAQSDRWPEADRERWAGLRSRATREVVLGVDYHVALLHARNSVNYSALKGRACRARPL